MPDILHDLWIDAPPARVFEAVSAPEGLDRWWTLRASGEPSEGAEYVLGFGPEHVWRGRVEVLLPGSELEIEITRADDDWTGTIVGFSLQPSDGGTKLRFRHSGWRDTNEHFRVSSYCWATYLRLLRRWLELGETVPYERRDKA
jgi:uncharacterized protein YndB with AHSA1/START domain